MRSSLRGLFIFLFAAANGTSQPPQDEVTTEQLATIEMAIKSLEKQAESWEPDDERRDYLDRLVNRKRRNGTLVFRFINHCFPPEANACMSNAPDEDKPRRKPDGTVYYWGIYRADKPNDIRINKNYWTAGTGVWHSGVDGFIADLAAAILHEMYHHDDEYVMARPVDEPAGDPTDGATFPDDNRTGTPPATHKDRCKWYCSEREASTAEQNTLCEVEPQRADFHPLPGEPNDEQGNRNYKSHLKGWQDRKDAIAEALKHWNKRIMDYHCKCD